MNTSSELYTKVVRILKKVFSKYKLISKDGEGAYGHIYCIEDNSNYDQFWVKVLTLENLTNEEIQEIKEKVEILTKLSSNHIIAYYEEYQNEDFYLVCTEKCEKSLDDYIKEKGKLDENQAIEWIIQILQALTEIHDSKMIHRDIRPVNIFIKNNSIKLGDFGIAKENSINKSLFSDMTSSLLYMSPNVWEEKYSYNSDVWSVGCVLYEMLNEERLFNSPGEILSADLTNLKHIENRDIHIIFEKMMNPNQNDRISARQCLEEFQELNEKLLLSYKPIGNNLKKDEKIKEKMTLKGHDYYVVSLIVLTNGNLASGSYDNTIRIWDVDTGEEIKVFKSHSSHVVALALMKNGDLASGSWDKTIKIWDVEKGLEKKTLISDNSTVLSLAVLPNGYLASGSSDGRIKIWNVEEGKEVKTLTGHKNWIKSLAVLKNEDLISASIDGIIIIWNLQNGEAIAKLKSSCNSVVSLAVLPNGDLASGSVDGTIKIWDLEKETVKMIMDGRNDTICDLKVMKTGHIVSASHYNVIQIWNYKTGEEKKIIRGHTNSVWSLTILPNGDIVSGACDNTIKIWRIEVEDESLTT